MKLTKPQNVNYCAEVATVSSVRELDNCDNVKAAMVSGFQVIVSNDTKGGDVGILFTTETKLSDNFLSNNNLFRHKEKNVDPEKAGYFEDNGRLRAVKFRGHRSEGLFMPLSSLAFAGVDPGYLENGDQFDSFDGIPICKKYVVIQRNTGTRSQKDGRKPRASRMVDNQFRFHRDTSQLKRNIHMIKPFQVVSITKKMHGTSAVFANVLVKRKLSIFSKFAKLFGIKVQDTEYDLVYSSRKVVKNKHYARSGVASFYKEDVWGHWANKIREFVPKGMTIYAEIVGYTAPGSMIQKGFDYGCADGESELYVYRITQTNIDGNVTELSMAQIKDFCTLNNLNCVPIFRVCRACDIYSDQLINEVWGEMLLARLSKDDLLDMNDVKDDMCENDVPAEGCVVRIEDLYYPEAFKLKNYSFLEFETKMLDDGEVDIEEDQGQGEDTGEDN